jgi:hypothetical protein
MKSFQQSLVLMLSVAFAVFSCQPENVSPRTQPTDAPTLEADGSAHPWLTPCGNSQSLQLINMTGTTQVDDCGASPCGPSAPEWGVVDLVEGIDDNGDHVLAASAAMAFGWFIKECDSKIGLVSDFALNGNGIPVVDASWTNWSVTPAVATWELRHDLALAPSCFVIATRMKVVKRDFFQGEIPGTDRELWLYNSASLGSTIMTDWCVSPCVVLGSPNAQDISIGGIGQQTPNPTCTQSQTTNIQVADESDVVCVGALGQVGTINFAKAGTLVIPTGAKITGGITAPKGGTLIVNGEFIWSGKDQVSNDFEIVVNPNTGQLTR